MIETKITANITAAELKKLITEYMEAKSNLKVTRVSFNVSNSYDHFDRPIGLAFNSVDVTFDSKEQGLELKTYFPPGIR